jgi:hypothetical protein
MDPQSPTKLAMSPGMPVFPVSPERVAGTKPQYTGSAPQSPSMPNLRTSPLRVQRNRDSQVDVMASMFDNLNVKDPHEAHQRYMQKLEEATKKHARELGDLQKKYSERVSRLEVLNEDLSAREKALKATLEKTVPKEDFDEIRRELRETSKKWEGAMRKQEEEKKQLEKTAVSLPMTMHIRPGIH